MTKSKSGGPAFPLYKAISNEEVTYTGYTKHDFTMGMTLRDYFAGKALSGGLEQGLEDDMNLSWWHDPSKVAKRAYEIADAMLRARNG